MKKNGEKKKYKLSDISVLHYIKLVYRSVLFVAATVVYILNRINNTGSTFGGFENNYWLLGMISLVFVVEMVFRFFPSRLESMGCQKQFAKNYKAIGAGTARPVLQSWKRTFLVAVVWLALNAVFGILYYAKIFDAGILVLISLAFSVCDMICILFFCPFQTWFMKNKCCTSCRIYNWDYAMMFTPLVFVANLFTWGLLAVALALLARWEITVRLYPERFAENTNGCLSCGNCKEKLCQHKKQLHHFIAANRKRLHLKGNELISKYSKSQK